MNLGPDEMINLGEILQHGFPYLTRLYLNGIFYY